MFFFFWSDLIVLIVSSAAYPAFFSSSFGGYHGCLAQPSPPDIRLFYSYISILCFVSSGIIWFGTFTLHDCQRSFLFPPLFKGTYHIIYCAAAAKSLSVGLQVTVSQLILGIRYVMWPWRRDGFLTWLAPPGPTTYRKDRELSAWLFLCFISPLSRWVVCVYMSVSLVVQTEFSLQPQWAAAYYARTGKLNIKLIFGTVLTLALIIQPLWMMMWDPVCHVCLCRMLTNAFVS